MIIALWFVLVAALAMGGWIVRNDPENLLGNVLMSVAFAALLTVRW